jgi:hypothetical protein
MTGVPESGSTDNATPRGERRNVSAVGGVTIGGTPVSYVAIMAAIVAVLAFVPASVVIGGTGAGWPLHDAIHPLVGLILGPIAGPIASAIGILVGMAIAPHTSLGPWSFLMGVGSAGAVGLVLRKSSWQWAVGVAVILIFHVIYFAQATAFGIGTALWFSNAGVVTLAALIIAIPPIRIWARQTILDEETAWWKMLVALYIPFLFGSVSGMQLVWVPAFATNPWPAEVWPVLIPVIWLERTLFPLIGALVAIGVIKGLRRTAFVKPTFASY